MALILSAKRFLGFGKETTPGTPASTFRWLPVTGPQPEQQIKYVPDPGFRSIAATTFGEYQGVKNGRFQYGLDWYPTDTPLLLTSILGPDTVSGSAPGMFTHQFTLASNQPNALTVRDYDGIDEYQMASAYLDSVSWTLDAEGKLTSTVGGLAFSPATQSLDTPVFVNEAFFLGWEGTLSIGGVSDLNLLSMQIDFKRRVTPRWSAQNAQEPHFLFSAPLAVTGRFTFDVQDDTEYSQFTANKQQSHLVTLTQAPNLAATIAASPNGATEAGTTVTITTTAAHGFTVGQIVTVAGVAVAGYNGTFTIATVPTTTTFTYVITTTGLAGSGGGTVAGGGQLVWQMSKLVWLTAVKTARQDWLQVDGTFEAVYNAVDSGPALVKAINGQSAAY